MKLKREFTISNLVMFSISGLLIVVVSVVVFLIYFIKYIDTSLKDTSGFVNGIGNVLSFNPLSTLYVIVWLIFCAVIIISINAMLNKRLSKKVIEPLGNMTDALKKIKSGDLSFEILGSEYYEINELAQIMNEMRISLKENVDSQVNLANEKNMMLAHLSHDLKTPITSIKSYAEGIKDGVANTPQKVDSYVDTIISKAVILEKLASNLSEYSHLELNKSDFCFKKADIIDFLNEIIYNYKNDFEKNGLILKSDIKTEKYFVVADFEKLYRVFSNLLDNSIKYRRTESKIATISTNVDNNGIYIMLTDDGMGIDQNKINDVFKNFYRVDDARTMNISGNGLGLSIARKIVQKHGGKIWLKNNEGMSGTTAIIFIPKSN